MTVVNVGAGRLDVVRHPEGDAVTLSCVVGGDQSGYTWTATIHVQGQTPTALVVDDAAAAAGTIIVQLPIDTAATIPPGRHRWHLKRASSTVADTILTGSWITVGVDD